MRLCRNSTCFVTKTAGAAHVRVNSCRRRGRGQAANPLLHVNERVIAPRGILSRSLALRQALLRWGQDVPEADGILLGLGGGFLHFLQDMLEERFVLLARMESRSEYWDTWPRQTFDQRLSVNL